MKKTWSVFLLSLFSIFIGAVKADFGDADFPIDLFKDGPKSYHDAWCRTLKNKCRVRFQGPAMWVEGQGGIQRDQLISYRHNQDTAGAWGGGNDHYNYISYISKSGVRREALFLFKNRNAQREFFTAFIRWKRQEALPIPNYKYPNSQGPQDTQGRDNGLNPYDNPPINDWSKKTTKDSPAGINCDSIVWRNKPECK